MDFSVVTKSSLLGDFRIDAELYQPRYQRIENTIIRSNYTTLGEEISLFKKGIFDINSGSYCADGIPFVRIENLKDLIIDDNEIVYIPDKIHNQNLNTSLEYGDIILSKTAYPAASLVTLNNCNTSQDTIAVKLKDDSKINNYFLVAFLNTKFGLPQMKRWFTGNIQMHLNLTDGRRILIPVFSNQFQNFINDIVMLAVDKRIFGEKIFRKIADLIINVLSFNSWLPNHKLGYTKNFSGTETAVRFDAEYFQPKYDELVSQIKQYSGGYESLENLVNIKDENFTPESNNLYKYIELANIGNNGEITGFTEAVGSELPTRARRKVSSNDIIVSSIEGSLSSIALIEDSLDGALCSTGFYIINSDFYNSETLLVLLKSIVGQLQLKKGCSGTILTAINKGELSKIILPKIDQEIQNEIKLKISEMYDSRGKSKALIEIAKRGVEMAIEQDETTAENWINEELEKLGVELNER